MNILLLNLYELYLKNAYNLELSEDGSIYVVGKTNGNLNGIINSGLGDAYITKFDSNGNTLWTKVIGGNDEDSASNIAISKDGFIYM